MPYLRGALLVASAHALRQHAEPSDEVVEVSENAVSGLKDWYQFSYMKKLGQWTTKADKPGPRPYYLKAPGGPIDMKSATPPWPAHANPEHGPVLRVEPTVPKLPKAPEPFSFLQQQPAAEAKVEWKPMYAFFFFYSSLFRILSIFEIGNDFIQSWLFNVMIFYV